MLRLSADAHVEMLAHAYAGLPNEACGLLGGHLAEDTIEAFVPCRNVDASSRTYSIGPDGWLAADEAFEPLGLEVVGVMHSHTHTEAYPSPTDVDKGDNPLLEGWHFVIVSLRLDAPVLRSYRIVDRNIVEDTVVLSF